MLRTSINDDIEPVLFCDGKCLPQPFRLFRRRSNLNLAAIRPEKVA